ncbi:hypothetical protein JXM83_00380 [Candidatus Woesearchaeota archaeon]|nr:hypothetical protein [Candidatus Woesearchaeota archaeon]
MFSKRGGDKKGMFSVGMIIAFFMSVSIAIIVVFVLLTQMDYTTDRALMSYAYIRDEVVVGSDLFYVDGVDGREGYLSNGTGMMRLSETSGAMRLDKTLFKITTRHGEGVYTFGGIGRDKAVLSANGTSSKYGVEFVSTTNDGTHNDITLKVGEVIKIFFIFPTPVYEDEGLELSMYPHNGRAETKRLVVPDIIVSERVQLYP